MGSFLSLPGSEMAEGPNFPCAPKVKRCKQSEALGSSPKRLEAVRSARKQQSERQYGSQGRRRLDTGPGWPKADCIFSGRCFFGTELKGALPIHLRAGLPALFERMISRQHRRGHLRASLSLRCVVKVSEKNYANIHSCSF